MSLRNHNYKALRLGAFVATIFAAKCIVNVILNGFLEKTITHKFARNDY